jgi:hypothetical protein
MELKTAWDEVVAELGPSRQFVMYAKPLISSRESVWDASRSALRNPPVLYCYHPSLQNKTFAMPPVGRKRRAVSVIQIYMRPLADEASPPKKTMSPPPHRPSVRADSRPPRRKKTM